MDANEQDIRQTADRARAWYAIATHAQRAEGSAWYANARTFCQHVADACVGLTVEHVAGVTAALSPAVYWDLNKRQAEALCVAYAHGGMESARQVVLSTYGKQAAKAYRILALHWHSHEPIAELREIICEILGKRAWKTRAFFLNILDDETRACIDRHMVQALGFADRWTQSARWCYETLERGVLLAAEELEIDSFVLQATIWFTYKQQADAYSAAEQGVQAPVRVRDEHEGDAMACPV
jgi:hypothetical protein